jgi:RHS repeat-associated protein
VNNLDNNYKFTGMERDTESALDHTLFRQYSSSLGRWLSPDPVVGTASDPQSWNRYPYVLNDPMTAVDPMGNVIIVQQDTCVPDPYFSWFDIYAQAEFLFGCGNLTPEQINSVLVGLGYGACGPGFILTTTFREILELSDADFFFGEFANMGLLSYELGPGGINVFMSTNLYGALVAAGFIAGVDDVVIGTGIVVITLGAIWAVQQLAEIIKEIAKNPPPNPEGVCYNLYLAETADWWTDHRRWGI